MRAPLLVAVALVAVLATDPTSAVYGGQDADEGEYPFMVHFFQKGDPSDNDASGGFICGGSLIAPTLVLTAGHCMESVVDRIPIVGTPASGGPYEDPQVLIGTADRSGGGGEIIDIAAMHQHPLWMVGPGLGSNDIAIIELERASVYAPVRVAVPGDEDLYVAGTVATALGWGWTLDDDLPDALQEIDLPVHSDLDCKLRPQYIPLYVPEQQICAGAPGKDTCGGDSGGPLLVRDGTEWVVAGITIYGSQFDCGDDMHPGVYLEVAAFRGFIDQYR